MSQSPQYFPGPEFAQRLHNEVVGPLLERFALELPYAAAWLLAGRHNALCLTEPVDPTPRPFRGGPFRVMAAERLSETPIARITDAEVLRVPPNLGGVDQVIASIDALENADRHHARRHWIGSGGS